MKEPLKIQKPRKRIQRRCVNCLGHFYATRSDAKYCSQSCRQRAYIAGEFNSYYSNPAEHFLATALQIFVTTFLEKEGRLIAEIELKLWINQSTLIKNLFFEYLSSDNYYKNKFENEIDGFFKHVHEELEEARVGVVLLTIPGLYKRSWERYLDAME